MGRLALLLVAVAVVAAGCGSASTGDRLNAYLGRVHSEQTAYRQAQQDALHALDLMMQPTPTRSDCHASVRLLQTARDNYNRLSTRMRGIRPPARLRTVHAGLARSLQLYSQYFDQIQQILRYCDPTALVAAAGSKLPDRAIALRAKWRVAVAAYAGETGVAVPGWTHEVGRLPAPSPDGTGA